jgi:glycolate oxidase subunit GlcD
MKKTFKTLPKTAPLTTGRASIIIVEMTDKKVIKRLEKLLGKDKVVTEKSYLLTYAYDAAGGESVPDIVVFPETENDIQQVLQTAYLYKIPVTPRGAGVGYTGGAVPIHGGISLVFTRMNKILSVDTESFYAEVEPGVVTYDLQQHVEKLGLFYPPDPASLKTSTIGGNVAENAGGLRCYKYGVTKNYVLGLEGFLANGEKFHAGAPVIKDVAGYDLKSLLIGSEGTLAVISKILLRLIPLPAYRSLFRVDFRSLKTGAAFINQMIRAGVSPSVLEFMDRSSIAAAYDYLELPLNPELNASVLIEIDGTKTDVEERKNLFLQLVQKNGGDVLECKMAETEEKQEELWNIRRNISPAIAKLRPKKINEDIVVPTGRIPETVDFINRLAAELDILIVLFGHFGDGNIHTNVMVDPDDTDEMNRAHTALDRIFRYVISVNGSITGEHGVGTAKKPFMKYQFSDTELSMFKKIKQAFDPENLLNPGKIF